MESTLSIDILTQLLGVYPEPDPLASEEQADRHSHTDLTAETDASLRREIAFLRWLNFITDSAWHQAREDQVAREMRRRHERRGGRGAA